MLQIACIAVPLWLMTMALPRMERRWPRKRYRQALYVLMGAYVAGNMYFTLITRTPGSGTVLSLKPFRIFRQMAELVPPEFENATGFVRLFLKDASPLTGALLNVLLYYPMGYILTALFPQLKAGRVLLIGCAASVLTELAQYLLAMGWCDIDDVIYNVLGTALGAFCRRRQTKGR